jgi:replicative DNA helicase
MDRAVPFDLQAERATLGSILIEREAIVAVAGWLPTEHFYLEKHALLYDAMLACYNRREPPDIATVAAELRRQERLDLVGGLAFLAELAGEVPTAVHVEYYARIVERTAVLRRLIEVGGRISAVGFDQTLELEDAIDKAEAELFSVSQRRGGQDFVHIGTIVNQLFTQIETLQERRGEVAGVATGYTDLDELTGGLQPSDLIILAARPSVGKCLAHWSLLDDPQTGERITIAEAVQRRLTSIHGISASGAVRATPISEWIDSGEQPCFRVRTRTGRQVDVTGHHPFLTVHGWTPLHDLRVGDSIAVPRAVPAFGTDESWPVEVVRLLAYVIAEGGLTAFPPIIWRWSRGYLAEFIRVLMSCAASIDALSGRIEFAVAAPQLAADLHHAFVRFGLIAKLYQTTHGAWRVEMTDPASIRRYQEEIGWIGRKSRRLSAVAAQPTRELVGAGARDSRRAQTDAPNAPAPLLARLYAPVRARGDGGEGESDLYWDPIISIEPIGVHQVYDLCVPDGANFIAQDICVHNTSLALSLAYNVAYTANNTVGVFSLEMSRDQLVQRMLSMHTGIDMQRLRTGTLRADELNLALEGMGVLSELPIYIEDTPSLSISEVRSKARRLAAEAGVSLLMIDYLQLMSGRRTDNRVQEVSEISRGLKALARELNVPVIALSQLSRAVEGRQSHVPMLSDLRESGCLTGESLVYLPDSGTYRRIDELVGTTGYNVLALNPETWKLEPRRVTNAFCTGVKPVYKLTTRLGRSIRATGNHKFLTINGWKRLDELTPNDRLALPRQLPGPDVATLSDDELALLGLLIGDGCTLARRPIHFTTADADMAELAAELATRVFGNAVKPRVQFERTWYRVYLAANARQTHGVRNPVATWLDTLGAFNLRSHEKRVPERVFAQSNAQIAHFLRHLWATDGRIHCSKKQYYPSIYYATGSQLLAIDVQSLLLRLGINAVLVTSPHHVQGRDHYRVSISGTQEMEAFLARIGGIGARKASQCAEVSTALALTNSKTGRDVIPREFWQTMIRPFIGGKGGRMVEVLAVLDYAKRSQNVASQHLSRDRALRIGQMANCAELQQLAESDVYWDQVLHIKPDGEELVYDLTVDEHHNFVANNITLSNSIEQDADIVMFIYREELYDKETDKKGIAEIHISKHRNGPLGIIPLRFEARTTRFQNLERYRAPEGY